MLILLILALSFISPQDGHLLTFISSVAEQTHKLCLQTLPDSSSTAPTLSALLCGSPLQDEKLRESLIRSSLIHIFIVSGSHLLFLDQLLSILRIPVFLRFMFLLLYSLFVNWQPPAVRALGLFCLRQITKRQGFFIPSDILTLYCGLIFLLLFPEWWKSLSFQLSWMASLALCAGQIVPPGSTLNSSLKKLALTQVCIYFLLLPLLWGFGSLHPLGLLFNLLISPLIAFGIFPLALSTYLHPSLHVVFESTVNFLSLFLSHFTEPIKIQDSAPRFPLSMNWLWIFSTQVFFHFFRVLSRRRHLKEPK